MKEKTRLGERPKAYCGGNTETQCAPQKTPFRTDSVLTWRDRLVHLRCRVGAYRMKATVEPGLYAIGKPDNNSDVFVSANYRMSFDILRSSLSGMDAWILVLDTNGINVWCAAGKGTFGTEELVKRIFTEKLHERVSHRRLILPQLGAPGVSAPDVRKQTGFRPIYGPVRAADIKAFVAAGYRPAPGMRRVEFGLWDRLVLTPMELRPALKAFFFFAAVILALSGLSPSGISFQSALSLGAPIIILGIVSIIAGAFITPALLPYIPFRAFAIKGWLAGLVAMLIAWPIVNVPEGAAFAAMSFLFFPLASSYLALQFTGSTAYTGMSGVARELKFSMPVYTAGALVSSVLFITLKLGEWGII